MAKYLVIEESKTTYSSRQVVVRVRDDMTKQDALDNAYLQERLEQFVWDREDDDEYRRVEWAGDSDHEEHCDIDLVGLDAINRLLDEAAEEDKEVQDG